MSSVTIRTEREVSMGQASDRVSEYMAQHPDMFETPELPTEPMVLNLGPSHPATHGTVRIVLTLEGEKIVDSDVEVGYLHRGFEKMCERSTWTQVFPYTDRLNYVSPMLNNVGYALAVEKLIGIKAPMRAEYIRVIVGELSRICDHLTCTAALAMELGAFTVFFYAVKCREWIWDVLEEVSGARMTYSYVRIGGVVADLTPTFDKRCRDTLDRLVKVVEDIDKLLTENRIFRDRCEGVGVISREDAIAYGFTGPCLRASGCDYDVRKDKPYSAYGDLSFDVPIGEDGDNYDRYLVRMEEVKQSRRMILQALDKIPDGPFLLDDPKIVLPPKQEVYNTIEGMINHFKLVIEGIRVPAGETYGFTEAGNGELGFFLVSDGSGHPYKCRVRPPCFAIMQALSKLINGRLLADLVPTFDTVNMIGGECDR
jgi:NADH-quinone oxidoreductase subunit D